VVVVVVVVVFVIVAVSGADGNDTISAKDLL